MLSRSRTFTELKCFDSTFAVARPDMPLPNTRAEGVCAAAVALLPGTAWHLLLPVPCLEDVHVFIGDDLDTWKCRGAGRCCMAGSGDRQDLYQDARLASLLSNLGSWLAQILAAFAIVVYFAFLRSSFQGLTRIDQD